MPKSSGRFNSLIVPLLTWLVLLIPFAIYQRYYVRSQQAYLTEHGFRLLAAVGRQFDSYVDSISKAVNTAKRQSEEASKLRENFHVPALAKWQVEQVAYEDYLRSVLPD